MKIPLSEVFFDLNINGNIENDDNPFLNFKFRVNNFFDNEIPELCSYSGSDITHQEKGICIYCDYEAIVKMEDKNKLETLDKTEWWDFYDQFLS